MTRRLDGQVVLITGAARGIGAETARQLIARGALVALVDRDAESVERCAAELGDRAIAVVADVTDDASVTAAGEHTVERFGGLDVVVANAGIAGTAATVATMEPAQFRQVVDV